MPRCNNCGVHMPVVQLVKRRRTSICEKATEMELRRIDVEMTERRGDMKSILYGR